MTIRILIADDQQIIRQAVRSLIDCEDDLEVVGEACNLQETLHQTCLLQPDVVLLDLAICRGDHIELLANIRQRQPETRTVILTTIEDEEVVVQTLHAGASGYLLKSITPPDLVQALRSAMLGGTPLQPRIANRVLRRLNDPAQASERYATLTPRECEILQLLAQGCSNREIARTLIITPYTVRSHVCNIFKKLDLNNRTQAALYLVRRQQQGSWPSVTHARSAPSHSSGVL